MEKGLITRARKKDNEAIAEIIQLTERKAYFIAYKVVNNEATAKDIVQEAYIQAFQKLDQLSDDSKLESWFNQIVSHKALDYAKSKQGKNKPVEFSSLDDEEDRLEFEANIKNDKASFEPEASMNYKELQEGVQGVLSELPENQRLALMMYYFEDMSVSEIADVYGVSGNTVKGYLAYGRKKIKNIIEAMREKGVSFYGVAPMPFLTWMLHDQMAKTAVSHVSKDIIIKTVGTSAAATTAGAAATKTGVSKSGLAKWWASKTASVKAGVCAGTVAVTGAVGYAAVDYNSNYNKVVRAVDKLNDLSIYHLEFKESVGDEYAVSQYYFKNTGNKDEYYGAYGGNGLSIEYKVENDQISYSMVDDFDMDNIDKRTFDNQITPTAENKDEYFKLIKGTKVWYTYQLTAECLKPFEAFTNVCDDKIEALNDLKEDKKFATGCFNDGEVEKDDEGNTVYSITYFLRSLDENNNIVEDKDHRKTYVTVNKDGYVINQKCIRVADEKLLFELTFDMFIEK